MVSGIPQLWNNGISTKLAVFKTIRRTGDIKKAGSKLNRVRANELRLEHIIKTKGDMQQYFKTHKDALINAEEIAEELLDEIRFSIADLQLLKHVIREMYAGDQELMKKGIPPKIGLDFEAGDKHTQEEINRTLRNLGMMFAELTREDNI